MTLSCSSAILLFLKKDKAAVLNSSKIEGVRFPFSRMGASLLPIKVVKGARPGRAGTEVEDMGKSNDESEEDVEDNAERGEEEHFESVGLGSAELDSEETDSVDKD